MTIDEVISLLKKQGQGTKRQVIKMLENASKEELQELRNSINVKIRKLSV